MPDYGAAGRDQHGSSPSFERSAAESVQRHYTVPALGQRILDALEKAGRDTSRLSVDDLAPIDEFHVRGRQATLELAEAARIQPHHAVLDVGSGIGGPARCLANEFGCRVTGLDLTEEYCRTATVLSERVGLAHLVRFEQGDAVTMPFPDASFDVVWTEHVAMNVADKASLYREMYRVLKRGGTLAIYDVCAGEGGPVHFPVPWARSEDTSFLASPEQLRRLVTAAGFDVTDWRDTTGQAREWFVALSERVEREGAPRLTWGMLMGDDFPAMARNQRRNLDEGRIALIQLVAQK
jgi:SAM-dependent methyltransferase